MDRMKERVRAILDKVNLVPSRKAPYLSRRYPFADSQKMDRALGQDLSRPIEWRAVDVVPEGELGKVFANTPGVIKWAHYLPVYDALLDRSRPIRMLEIGVFNGGSLRMWREILHPDSVIVGIDINPDCKQYDDPTRNIHVRIGSQVDSSFLSEVSTEFGPFDVILDDGSHMTSHMVESFRILFGSSLRDPGIYIVEDVHSNYWKSYRDSRLSFVDFIGVLVDAMHAHYQNATSELNFRKGHTERLGEVSVPAVTSFLDGIQIFDSIVVIRKRHRDLPVSIYVDR